MFKERGCLTVLTDAFSWETAASGRAGFFYLPLKTLLSATFQTPLLSAQREDVCAAIVPQQLEARVSKLKEVNGGQKEKRKLS